MPKQKGNIKLGEDVKKELLDIGKMGDSYEDVIKMLLAYYKEKRGGEEEKK